LLLLLKKVVYIARKIWYNVQVRKHHNMNNKQILKADIESMEQSIEFHTKRIETFGQPNPKGRFHVLPFDDVDPKHLLPELKRLLAQMKAQLKKTKA